MGKRITLTAYEIHCLRNLNEDYIKKERLERNANEDFHFHLFDDLVDALKLNDKLDAMFREAIKEED